MSYLNQLLTFIDFVTCMTLSLLSVEQLRLSCKPQTFKIGLKAVYPYKLMLILISLGSFSWAVYPTTNTLESPTIFNVAMHLGFLGLFYVHYYGGIKWRRVRIQHSQKFR